MKILKNLQNFKNVQNPQKIQSLQNSENFKNSAKLQNFQNLQNLENLHFFWKCPRISTTTLEFPAGSTTLGKSIVLNYKIERGGNFRVGQFVVCASTNGVTHDDTYNESADIGVTLSAAIGREDSSASDKTVIVKFTTTNTGAAATMDVQVEQLV